MRIVQLMTDRSRYLNPSKNYWFSFSAFLISLIDLYFRCLSLRVILVNAARPDGAFLLVVWFIHWKRMIRPFLFWDRPFNLQGGLWFFVSFRIFFSDFARVRIFVFCRAKREFFFQNLTLSYMTKTLNQLLFFSSTKIRIFFSATLGIRIFFLEKKHNPPFKLIGRSLTKLVFVRIPASRLGGKTSFDFPFL